MHIVEADLVSKEQGQVDVGEVLVPQRGFVQLQEQPRGFNPGPIICTVQGRAEE